MGKINYNDKQFLYQNADIPAENKINDVDMNEIKQVVNENDDKVGDLNTLNTTEKSSIVDAINEITPNSITGYLEAKLSYTSTKNNQKIPLILSSSKGNKFSVTSDGGIKIGAGVDKVLVNAQVYFYTGSNHTDGKHVYIYKNSTAVGRGSRRDNYNYIFIPAGPITFDVVENDVIYLYCNNDANVDTVIGEGLINTYMNVITL